MSFRTIFVLLFASVLAGCAASSVQRDFSLGNEPDKGVVIVSVSFDKSGSRNFQGTFFLDPGENALLPQGTALRTLAENPLMRFGSEFKDSYGQVLVLALPAGKHTINTWNFVRTPLYHFSPEIPPEPLEFQVEAGTIQYLGNLHLNLDPGERPAGNFDGGGCPARSAGPA